MVCHSLTGRVFFLHVHQTVVCLTMNDTLDSLACDAFLNETGARSLASSQFPKQKDGQEGGEAL